MDAFLSRFPTADAISDWGYRHRGKIAGLLSGTLGMFIATAFISTVLTGVPYGGERLAADRFIVYPNF